MKNIKVFATAAILSVTVASAAFAGGPTILDADLQPAVALPPVSSGFSPALIAVPVVLCLLLCGGGSSSTTTTASGS